MKYSDEEALKEILKRSDKVVKKRNERTKAYLGGACAVLFAALVAAIALMPGGISTDGTGETVYGAFLLGREAGGYVLAALVAFLLGIGITLYVIKKRKPDKRSGKESE